MDTIPDPVNEIRITDIDGRVLVWIALPFANKVTHSVQGLLDDGLIDPVAGIYSLEYTVDDELVDEIYWMTPDQARAVLQRFAAPAEILSLITDFLPAANDPLFG